MNPEDVLYDPNMMALVLERESVEESYLENNPYIQFKKELASGYSIIYVKDTDVDKVIRNIENYAIYLYPLVLGLMGSAQLSASGITQVHQQPYLNLRGSGVLLGFIDTGIDYTQDAFRYEDGSSKIINIWDQTIRGDSPEGFPYGTEYSNDQINEALLSENPRSIVPHEDTVGHGTFLASIAGSRQPEEYLGAAPDSEIIAVKLRGARGFDRARHMIPDWQENAYSSDDFMMGIQYIVDKAMALRKPVAICVSLGTNAGGHDGFLPLGGFMSRISSIIGVTVCTAAGNEGQAGHHIQGRFSKTGEAQNIELRIGPGSQNTYVSIWNQAIERISVSVRSPTGEQVLRVPARPGTRYESNLVLERATVTIEYQFPIERSGAQITRVLIFNPTPGIWTITVYADMIMEGVYHAWVPITGFVDPGTAFLAPTPNYTIVTPGNALGVITCGAYSDADNSFAAFSSQGPTRMGTPKPDLVAPGVNVAGIYPTGPGIMSGTSISSAITTGACALMLQWGIVEKNDTSIDSYRVRTHLITGCTREPNVDYPSSQWGYGRLNLYNTFRALRPY